MIKDIEARAAHIGALQAQARALAMVYQYDLKVSAARFLGYGLTWQDLDVVYYQLDDIRAYYLEGVKRDNAKNS